MRVSSASLFRKAYGKYGIGAFNVFTAEQVHAVFKGALLSSAPVIVAITPAARRYMQPCMLDAMIRGAEELYPDVIHSVHLDHGNEPHCTDSIDSGDYTSVMIDASLEPFEENIKISGRVSAHAHVKGVDVEAELGMLGGKEDDITGNDRAGYTDPEQAVEFIDRTGCNALAVAVGTSHGAYKGSGKGLRLDILAEIQKKLPSFPLVLHGASNVPLDEVRRINKAGGTLKESAKGIADEQLKEAIKLGVCKINVATDARLIWTRVHREFFRDSPDLFDPVIPGAKYMEELAEFVASRCRLFGAEGQNKG